MGASRKVPVDGLDERDVRLRANSMRRDIIDMLERGKSGHPGGSLSATDAIATLYFSGIMDYDQNDPDNHDGDHFFLSKGHAGPALYAAFHQLGWLSDEDMLTFRQVGSKLQGHPDCHACSGIEICSGSLGQGLSVGAGTALGLRMDGSDKHVFVLVGDGEMEEGSNWEALMFAAHKGLGNLTLMLDLNKLQIDGPTDEVCSLGDIDAKFAAFGWDVQRIDGHDITAIYNALSVAKQATDVPQAIILDTIKGKGVSYMEGQVGWHGKAPNAEQAAVARAEIAAERERIEKEA